MKTSVIITAGGSGKRMGGPKQFLPLLGKPMIEWTIEAFKKTKGIDEIIVVVAEENIKKAKEFVKLGNRDVQSQVSVTISGPQRTDSVRNGLKLVSPDSDIVLIHDGARPLVTSEIVEKAIKGASDYGAVVIGVPVKDTIKKVGSCELEVVSSPDREFLWQAQTPQAFKYEIIKRAYEKATSSATDDSKLVEDLGVKVKMVMGSYENIKVTTPDDVIIAEAILRNRK